MVEHIRRVEVKTETTIKALEIMIANLRGPRSSKRRVLMRAHRTVITDV